MLHQVQFMGCNASGICAGVDANSMPKITAISLSPDGSVQSVRDILRCACPVCKHVIVVYAIYTSLR